MSKLARPITRDEVAAYRNAGVVLLRGIFNLPAVNALRRSIDDAVRCIDQSPSGNNLSRLARAPESSEIDALKIQPADQNDAADIVSYGSFFVDTGVSSRLKEFRRFAVNGPSPEIAAAFLESEKVNFYGDQIFVKEPGTRERTAFHQDAAYFEIDGDQCCVLWIPVDPVKLESGAEMYIRGSHRNGKLYQPNVLISQTPLPGAQGDALPNIEDHPSDYDIVHFDVEPGDVIVHHYRTVHGAGSNASRYQVQRAASLRYCGDDIKFQARPWAPKQLHHTHRLQNGDPLDGPDFPLVWRRRAEQEAA